MIQPNSSCFDLTGEGLLPFANEPKATLGYLCVALSCLTFCVLGHMFSFKNIEKKESVLKKMGFQDFDTFYQTNRQAAESAILLSNLFKKQNLNLSYDQKEDKLLAYDSTFSDIRDMQKSLGEGQFPRFYIKNQTIYADLNDMESEGLVFETPSSENWVSYLRADTKVIEGTPDILFFSSGKSISKDEFVTHPLFKNTQEKHNVFRFLTSFAEREDFQVKCGDFLQNIQKENWFDSYEARPQELAYLSLFAFLEGRISKQDLFVVHMTASALQESSDEERAEITVLQEGTAAEYLKKARYPPFDATFYTSKNERELKKAKKSVLASLKGKSPLQRTAVAYPIFKKDDAEAIESRIIHGVRCTIGYRSDKESDASGFIVIPPPLLCLGMYRETSSLLKAPPTEHTWMFGYNNDRESLNAFKKGRAISIASPLFLLPYVHGLSRGRQLGVTMHDLLYHVPLDWQNPYVHIMIQLGKEVLKLGPHSDAMQSIGIDLLDREQPGYQKQSHEGPERIFQLFWELIGVAVIDDFTSQPLRQMFFSALKKQVPSQLRDLEGIEKAAFRCRSLGGKGVSPLEKKRLKVASILSCFVEDFEKSNSKETC